ncbi:MAG: hypothetical protein HY547_03005 [Elusimicrobia bacterium]|nr:hypothetical protein [Elusimicrobiota bacterium]
MTQRSLTMAAILFLISIMPLRSETASTGTLRFSGHLIARYVTDENAGTADSISIKRAFLASSYAAGPSVSIHVRALLNKLYDQREGLSHAFIDWKTPLGSLEFGQILMPTSRENMISSADLDFTSRAATILQLYSHEPEGADIGVKWRWSGSHWEAAAALVNGAGPNTTDDTTKKTAVGRVGLRGGDIGIAAYGYGGDEMGASGPVTKNRWGGELALGREGQGIRVEYHRGQDESVHSRGWFVQADLILGIFSNEAYRKWSWLQKIRPMARVESYDPDINTFLNRQTTTSLALHILPNPQLRLSLQQDWVHEEDINNQTNNDLFTLQAQARF